MVINNYLVIYVYGLDSPEIKSRWGRDFPHPSRTVRPAFYTIITGSLSWGVKQLGCGIDHPPPSSAEVKERVQLYLYSPSAPLWPVIGWTFTFTLHCNIYKTQRLYSTTPTLYPVGAFAKVIKCMG